MLGIDLTKAERKDRKTGQRHFQVSRKQWQNNGGNNMSEDEIKDLIQTELEESGYMYALGMLKGMYKAGAFNAVEWCTLSMYLADLNMDRIG